MEASLKRLLLPVSVFITGACVLIVEIVAIRILSPYYGNTIFTVSGVLSVILAALGAGYYAGGRFADRHPTFRWFFWIVLAGGLALLASHSLGKAVLPGLSLDLPLTTGPLASSMLLFFLPAFLLGALSPYAVKLQSLCSPQRGVGSVAGGVFFWSTLGSIAGSLLTGFVLIPHLGVDRIITSVGVTLVLLGFVPLLAAGMGTKGLRRSLFAIAVPLVLAALIVSARRPRGDAVYSRDGVYERITLHESPLNGRPTRVLRQDRSRSAAMFLDSEDPTDLACDYSKYYALYRILKPDVRQALVIGGGGYSIAKALLAELPDARVDVSEIEPSLPEIAKRFFRLQDDPRLVHCLEDGRRLLRTSGKKYDLIFGDAYCSLFSVPAHLATREFFSIAKDRMTKDGVFIANLIGDLHPPSLILAEIKTFRSVFPNFRCFAVLSPGRLDYQNFILVGCNGDRELDLDAPAILHHEVPVIRALPDQVLDVSGHDLSPYPVLTDDFCPVEHLTAKTLRRAFGSASGAPAVLLPRP